MAIATLPTQSFRHARCYAPAQVIERLTDLVRVRSLALVIDVDAFEQSALARIDRVTQLALTALANEGVSVVFTATREIDRALRLYKSVLRSQFIPDAARARTQLPEESAIVISDNPALFADLRESDRGIALDRTVRATLWWLLDERLRVFRA